MIYYLSIGANLGEREQTINQAVSLLESVLAEILPPAGKEVGRVLARSDFYYSEPVGFTSKHQFCNICVKLTSGLSPQRMLYITQDIEKALGRTEKTAFVNGQPVYRDREIDIDILMAFDMPADSTEFPLFPVCIRSKRLTLPHPRMDERDFVKIPLAQIFPFSE